MAQEEVQDKVDAEDNREVEVLVRVEPAFAPTVDTKKDTKEVNHVMKRNVPNAGPK